MRIIAGQRRGHKFDGPKGSGTRPTSDLVRESLFNILGAYVEDLVVVDLFAGTGALGLEALSRGAARAIFVEKKGENVALIHRNMATLRYEDRASVLAADAYRWARTFEPIDDEPMVVFLDPPYREYEERPHKIRELIENLIGNLPAGSMIALESSRKLDADLLPDVEAWDVRRYGGTQIAIRTVEGGPEAPRRTHPKSPTMSKSDRARQFAMEVVGKLQGAGFRALWAGGCVRDLMLGLTPADYDVATDATPEQVIALFGRRTVPVGVSFGVVRVLGPHGSGIEVEVATFRSDGAYVDGRRPESVTFSSPELDAARRDFTINGMFLDPFTDEVIDYVGGRADLRDRILRAIGDPAARFREDKLRLLRAVRFAARFGMAIEPETRSALRAMAGQVVQVAAERIAQELRKMLVHERRATAMQLALDEGLAAAILPPVVAMRGMAHGRPVQPEGDLWDHTLLVLRLLPAGTSFPLAFAALLHDVGKPATLTIEEGRARFPDHEQAGRRIADELCRQLKLSNQERERVTWLVGFAPRPGSRRRALRDSQLKRLLARPGIDELLALHRADALANTGDTRQVDYCEAYLRDQPAGPINPPPLVTGDDLVQPRPAPRRHFARLLEQVRDAQLDRVVSSKEEALEWLDLILNPSHERTTSRRSGPELAPTSTIG